MKFAYVQSDQLDQDLSQVAADLTMQGYRVGGVVQTNTPRSHTHRCDMDVQVLLGGPSIRISQNLGAHTCGCQLDTAALMTAVNEVSQRLTPHLDLLIINKFGRHEAEGRGFRGVIGEAISLEIPVLVGVNGLNQEAFVAFSGGLAQAIQPQLAPIKAWLQDADARGESSPVAACNELISFR